MDRDCAGLDRQSKTIVYHRPEPISSQPEQISLRH